MNTKNKIIAILMASVMTMAMAVPMVIGDVPTTATVNNEAPVITDMWFEVDGVVVTEVDPTADDKTTITVVEIVYDPNGWETLDSVVITGISPNEGCSCQGAIPTPITMTCVEYGDCTTAKCTATFDICHCYDPGVYAVTNLATDTGTPALTDERTESFTYTALTAMAIDFNAIDYGAIELGVTKWVLGNNTMEPPASIAPTVKNTGNVVFDVDLNATDMLQGGVGPAYIPAEDLGANVCGVTHDLVKDTCVWFNIDLVPCTPNYMDFSINTMNVPEGNYAGDIVITAGQAP